MGKNSLIKKTDKKKTASGKGEEEKKAKPAKKSKAVKKAVKKDAPPKKAVAAKKKTVKAKSAKKPAKTKTTSKTKTTAKPKKKTEKKTAPKVKKSVKKPKTKRAKKLSVKELVFKQFDSPKPDKIFKPDRSPASKIDYTAPPFISGTDKVETKRKKALLLKKFSMAEIVEAGKKAAAEKAAAEKAAAEKAAAEKAEAEKMSVAYEQSSVSTGDGVSEDKTVQYAVTGLAAGVAIIFLMIILASISNMGNFYLTQSDDSLEIWQGKFAPLGKKMTLALPGVEAAGNLDRVYSKQEVYPIAFDFYVNKADNLLETTGIPDFEKIKSHLTTSLGYAVTADLHQKAQTRLNHIDLMLLTYKATVLAGKESIDDLDKALSLLDQAAVLAAADETQVQRINQKIETIENKIRELEAAAVEAEAAEAQATE